MKNKGFTQTLSSSDTQKEKSRFMINNQNKNNLVSGFIALMSVILISAILMLIAVTLSTASFYSRYNILDFEFKEKSAANADACVDTALLLIANNLSNLATSTITVSPGNTCELGPIPSSGNPRIFLVTANTNNFFTNIRISVDPGTLSINLWEEIATY